MCSVFVRVRRLEIGVNELSGPIPSEIGGLVYLQKFAAEGNELTGTVPAEMSRMNPNLDLNLTDNL